MKRAELGRFGVLSATTPQGELGVAGLLGRFVSLRATSRLSFGGSRHALV
jgi:hypothetical protein